MPCDIVVLCGISNCFQLLSPCVGQIAHALLTRPPLELKSSGRSFPISIPARLACVKHAASVRPEPGSNSDVQSLSCFTTPSANSPKPAKFVSKPSVYSLRNLTVYFLDLLYSLYRFQGSCALRSRSTQDLL